MITGFFITVITAIANAFVGLLPVYDLPTQWTSAVATIWGLANTVSYLFPLATLVQILVIVVFLHVSVFVWHLTIKIYHMIRGR